MSEHASRAIVSPVGSVYTSEETADILHTSRRTVQRLIREGQLKSYKVGRGYRILARDIEQFFRNQEATTTTNPA